ncbi:MAG: hypothetical protein HY927_02490 [Elusimicrobia bacterium]|nr:hypothetical protein [Elusimicrobiota bacterium]
MSFFAVAILVAGLSHASPAVETAASGAASAFEAASFKAPRLEVKGAAPFLAAASQNKVGTVTGGMNHSPVNITIDKRAWTIKGGMNHSPVDVAIDHENNKITGGANLSPVSLSFAWTPESVVVEGGANRSPVKLAVDWKKGLLEGYANHSPVRVEFDMKEGSADDNIVALKGYAKHAPVVLQFDKVTGNLTGGMGHAPVNVTFVNADLYDFLQYFFLFLGQ